MVKVLMISRLFPPNFGGAAVQSIRLAQALMKRGLHVEFFTDNGSGPTIKGDRFNGIPVTRAGTYSDAPTSKFRELVFCFKLCFFVMRRRDLQLLHFHSVGGLEILLFPLFKMMGKKVVLKLTLVDSDDPLTFKNRRYLSPLYMWGLRSVHSMVAISEELRTRSLAAGIATQVVRKIFNGFDEDSFFIPDPQLKSDLRQKLGIDESAQVILSIGKVEHRKGYDLLLESYKFIQQRFPGISLVIVGTGNTDQNPFYVELCRKIEDNGLSNVSFVGNRDNAHEYIKAADYFFFCSRQEGFGTVMIEAMACGLPTVVTNIAGITEEIVTDPRIGRISYSRQPEKFAHLALEFISKVTAPDIEASIKELKRRFSMTGIAQQYIELYADLLKMNPAAMTGESIV
ncbi:MAG TPA: glycosyltransferase family 4 protein [Methylophilaceae bacterium]